MTTEEIKNELYRMLSDVVNGGYPKRTYAQQARYKEAVERTVDALDVLEQMSHSEKPNKWIPATTLPEKDGEYLLFGKIDETEENHIFIGEYDSCGEEFGIWQEQFDGSTLGCLGSEFYEYASVLAWIPLPAPFKSQESDDESCDDIWEKAYREREGKK